MPGAVPGALARAGGGGRSDRAHPGERVRHRARRHRKVDAARVPRLEHLEAARDLRAHRGRGAQRRRPDDPLAVPTADRRHRRPRHRAVRRAAQAAQRDRHPRRRRGVDGQRRPARRDGPLAASGAPEAERAVRRRSAGALRRPVPAGAGARRCRRARLLRRPLPLDVVLRRTGLGRGGTADLRAGHDPPPARTRVQAVAQRGASRRGDRRDGAPAQHGRSAARHRPRVRSRSRPRTAR